MVSIPFIYFGLLLLRQLRKNRWQIDIASFTLAIYTVSSFFSILIDVFDLRSMDTRQYVITPWATIAYCGLLTMCIWPFMKYSNLMIKEIRPLHNVSILKFFAWLFFIYFLLNLVMSFGDIVNVVTSDDISKIRGDHYKDNDTETWMSKLSTPIRLPFVILNLMSGSSWVFIFLAFYMIVIQKTETKYGFMYIIASISGVLENMLVAGRSAMVYWIIAFVACFLFFKPYMTKKTKKAIGFFSTIIGVCFIAFLAAVTISRFGERDAGDVSGTQGGLISYAGQSFINFCYFFDSFNCPFPSLLLIFPFTSKLILGDYFINVLDLQELITLQSGIEIGVFYTFLGHIIVTSNNVVMLIYALLLFSLSISLVKKIKREKVNLNICYFYYLYSSVTFLGFFTLYYAGETRNFSVAFWGLLLMFLSKNQRLKVK